MNERQSFTCVDSSSVQTGPLGPSAQSAAAPGWMKWVSLGVCSAGGPTGGLGLNGALQTEPLAAGRSRPHFWLPLSVESNPTLTDTPKLEILIEVRSSSLFSFTLTGGAKSFWLVSWEFSWGAEVSTSSLWVAFLSSSIISVTCKFSLVWDSWYLKCIEDHLIRWMLWWPTKKKSTWLLG